MMDSIPKAKVLRFDKLEKPYLIGEIGINHNGDMQIAKRLMDAVFACQWDCAKFQKRNPDKAVPEHEKAKPRETPWGAMTYLEYKHRIEFGGQQTWYAANGLLHQTIEATEIYYRIELVAIA